MEEKKFASGRDRTSNQLCAKPAPYQLSYPVKVTQSSITKAIKTEVGTKNSLSISRHILAKLEEFYFGCLHFFLYLCWSNLF